MLVLDWRALQHLLSQTFQTKERGKIPTQFLSSYILPVLNQRSMRSQGPLRRGADIIVRITRQWSSCMAFAIVAYFGDTIMHGFFFSYFFHQWSRVDEMNPTLYTEPDSIAWPYRQLGSKAIHQIHSRFAINNLTGGNNFPLVANQGNSGINCSDLSDDLRSKKGRR